MATSIPGERSEYLQRADLGRKCEVEAVPPLRESEARAIAEAVFEQRYHRKVSQMSLKSLLAKRTAEERPAYANPLWLDLALQELNLLEADDFAGADVEFSHLSGADRMEALLVSEAEGLPSSIMELYGELLARAERTFGRSFTCAVATFTALGRGGWRELDLRALVPEETSEPWSDLAFAGVRRTLGRHIVQRGEVSSWDFFHAGLRAASNHRYIHDPARRRALHSRIASHLRSLPKDDPLRTVEHMYHLISADEPSVAANHYAMLSTGPELVLASRTLARHVLDGLGSGSQAGLDWVFSFFEQNPFDPFLTTVQHSLNGSTFVLSLSRALEHEGATNAEMLQFLGRLEEVVARLKTQPSDPPIVKMIYEHGDDSPERLEGLVSGEYADCLARAGEFDAAVERYQRATSIFRDLCIRQPNDRRQSDLAEALRAQAGLLERLGRPDRAQELRNEALRALPLDLAEEDGPSQQLALTDLTRLAAKGQNLVKARRFASAVEFYETHLGILEEGYQQDPTSKMAVLLGRSCGQYATALELLDRKDAALDILSKGIDIGERAYHRDLSIEVAQNLVPALEFAGRLRSKREEYKEAAVLAERAATYAQRLYDSNPNVDTLGGLAVCHNSRGNYLLQLSLEQEARAALRRAHDLFDQDFRQHPSGSSAEDLAASHQHIGRFAESEEERHEHLRYIAALVNWMTEHNIVPSKQLLVVATAYSLFQAQHGDKPRPLPDLGLDAGSQEQGTWQDWIKAKDTEEAEDARKAIPALERRQRKSPSLENARKLLQCYQRALTFPDRQTMTNPASGERSAVARRGLRLLDWIEASGEDLGKDDQLMRSFFELACPGQPEAASGSEDEPEEEPEPELAAILAEHAYGNPDLSDAAQSELRDLLADVQAGADSNDWNRAELPLRKTLLLLDQCLGQFNPATAAVLDWLGQVFVRADRGGEAVTLYENAMCAWEGHADTPHNWAKLFRMRLEDVIY